MRPTPVLATLADIARQVQARPDLDDVLGPILRILGERLGLRRVALSRREPISGDTVIEAGFGLTPAEVRRGRYGPGEGVIGWVVQERQPAVVPDITRDPRFVDRTGALDGGRALAFVCVPVTHDDEVVGAMWAYRLLGAASLDDDAHLLGVVAALLAPLLARRVRERAPTEGTGSASRSIIGRSKAMQRVFGLIDQVAASPATVLLLGESGTGKELVASAIHQDSPRRRGPLVTVNCAALPESVIESELFGHERGAFTGATQRRKGRFELADGGTLFLDEIGDLSPAVQVKLLRVLQERQFERVGGNETRSVDVRIIAATSRDLEAMMEAGTFRADLYYRLNVFPIFLPPLRERGDDVLLLAEHFIEVLNRAHGRSVRRLSTPAIDMLLAYHWPGNVRELENGIERAVLLARDDVILGHHLPPSLQTADASDTRPREGLKAALESVERELVFDALKTNRGNMAAAARDLHITERIMGLRVQKYGIDLDRLKGPTSA